MRDDFYNGLGWQERNEFSNGWASLYIQLIPVNRTNCLFGPNSKVPKQILLHKPFFIRLYGPKFHLIGPQNTGFEMNLTRKLSESNKKRKKRLKKFLLYTVT